MENQQIYTSSEENGGTHESYIAPNRRSHEIMSVLGSQNCPSTLGVDVRVLRMYPKSGKVLDKYPRIPVRKVTPCYSSTTF